MFELFDYSESINVQIVHQTLIWVTFRLYYIRGHHDPIIHRKFTINSQQNHQYSKIEQK